MPQEDRPTEVPALEVEPYRRFSLRTLLIATTVFAFVAAAAGIHYRSVNPKAQPYLLIFWATVCLLLPILVWRREHKRARSISKLGRLLFVLPEERGFKNLYFRQGSSLLLRNALTILFVGYLLVVQTRTASVQGTSSWEWPKPIVAGCLFVVLVSPLVGSNRVSGKRVLLGESGLVKDNTFVDWKDVKSIESDPKTPGRRFFVFSMFSGLTFYIPEDQTAKVDAFIADRLAHAHKGETPI